MHYLYSSEALDINQACICEPLLKPWTPYFTIFAFILWLTDNLSPASSPINTQLFTSKSGAWITYIWTRYILSKSLLECELLQLCKSQVMDGRRAFSCVFHTTLHYSAYCWMSSFLNDICFWIIFWSWHAFIRWCIVIVSVNFMIYYKRDRESSSFWKYTIKGAQRAGTEEKVYGCKKGGGEWFIMVSPLTKKLLHWSLL